MHLLEEPKYILMSIATGETLNAEKPHRDPIYQAVFVKGNDKKILIIAIDKKLPTNSLKLQY